MKQAELRTAHFEHDYNWDRSDPVPADWSNNPLTIPEHWSRDGRMSWGAQIQPQTMEGIHKVGTVNRLAGAACPSCQSDLLVVMSLDLKAAGLAPLVKEFKHLTRLPFLYCPKCDGPTYRVLADDRVQILQSGDPEDPTPFNHGRLLNLSPKSVSLKPIPSAIHRDLAPVWNGLCDRAGPQDAEARQRVLHWFELTDDYDLPISQVGGWPLFVQGDWWRPCKFKMCPAAYIDTDVRHSTGERIGYDLHSGFGMTPLAAFNHHGIPELQEYYASIEYSICWYCLTIEAQYSCT